MSSGGRRRPERCLSHLAGSPEGSGWPPASRLAPSGRLSPEWAGTTDRRQDGHGVEGKYVTKSLTEHFIFDSRWFRGCYSSRRFLTPGLVFFAIQMHEWWLVLCKFDMIIVIFEVDIAISIPIKRLIRRRFSFNQPKVQHHKMQVALTAVEFWQVDVRFLIMYCLRCEHVMENCTSNSRGSSEIHINLAAKDYKPYF